MKTKWTVKIRIEDRNGDATARAIDRLKGTVHETVSALVAYYKHARPPQEAANIATNVESEFGDTARRPGAKRTLSKP